MENYFKKESSNILKMMDIKFKLCIHFIRIIHNYFNTCICNCNSLYKIIALYVNIRLFHEIKLINLDIQDNEERK